MKMNEKTQGAYARALSDQEVQVEKLRSENAWLRKKINEAGHFLSNGASTSTVLAVLRDALEGKGT
jgi:hypothetical protein